MTEKTLSACCAFAFAVVLNAATVGLTGCAALSVASRPSMAAMAVVDVGVNTRIPLVEASSKLAAPREGRKRDRAAISAQFHLEMEASESGPPSPEQIFRAHAQRSALLRERNNELAPAIKSAGIDPTRWEALGPSNVGGRVRALAFDPRNSARLFAGTASGGLWFTDNAGASWQAHFDFLPNLSITTIVVDPLSPDTMYLGTGEASAGLVGAGAFKSTDGGRTWRHLPSTNADTVSDWRFVNRLVIQPREPNVLLAGVTNLNLASGGIYRSPDAGESWTRVAAMKALNVAFDPNDPRNAVAGLDDGTIAFSRDAGLTWLRSPPLVTTPSGRGKTARAEIAFAPSAPGVVFASVDNAKGEVWRSVDSGATWAKLSTPEHLGTQGDYDNAIWVDPFDANLVVVGGLDLYRSSDGGATFTKVSDWRLMPSSPHADHHAIVSPPDYGAANPALWNGNDGGVYRTANIRNASATGGGGWSNMNNGLAVTQFYGGAGRSAAGGRIVGGTQDNGSILLQNGQWRIYRGGDGGFSAVDPSSDRWIYGEYVYLAIHRSSDGGLTSTYICNGITEALPSEGNAAYCGASATKKANFIAPFVLDPNDSNRLLAGATSLWVSNDAKAAAPTWQTIKPPTAATDNFINAVTVAEGNGNHVWVGHNNGELYRTANGLAAEPGWERVGSGVLPSRRVQRVLLDRDDHRRALVAFTGFTPGNLWETRDGGQTWRSATGNLPDAPIFDVKRHPRQSNWLYAATSVGLFTSEDGGLTWSTTNEGPANVRVRELFWLDDTTLVAATYGRGMFKVQVPALVVANYQDLWWAGPQENGWGMSITQHGDTLFSAIYLYDNAGKPTWVVMPGGQWDAGGTTYSGPLYVPRGAPFSRYDAAQFVVRPAVGRATLRFLDRETANLDYTINGVTGRKSIRRQAFGPVDATPSAVVADLWWGGVNQNGWGLAVSQQYRTLFAVWFTYDEAGDPTWMVLPGGQWSFANEYAGTLYRTRGSPWLGTSYDASRFVVEPVGFVRLAFDATSRAAAFTYTVDGLTQTKALVRQPFP